MSDGRDGYNNLDIGDTIEFEIRTDWDGRPRAFNITTSGGGAVTGGSHPDGCDCGASDASYGGEGDFSHIGGRCHNGSGGRGCYSCDEEVAALPMWSEGTALPVFDEMLPSAIVWDEQIGHDVSCRGGLLEQLARGGEYTCGEEILMESFLPPLTPSELIRADGKGTSICTAYQVFEEMPSLDVMWDKDVSRDSDLMCHGLLKQLAQRPELFVDQDQKLVANSNNTVKLTHVSEVLLELVVDSVQANTNAFEKIEVVSEQQDEVFSELPSKMVLWDEETLSDCNTHGGLQQLSLGVDCTVPVKVVLQTKHKTGEVLNPVCSSLLPLEHDGGTKNKLVERTLEDGMTGTNQMVTSGHHKIMKGELLGVVLSFPSIQVYEGSCTQSKLAEQAWFQPRRS